MKFKWKGRELRKLKWKGRELRKLKSERVGSSGSRVGHRVLFRSERIVLLGSFKERNVLLRSFFKFLATYETLKNNAFFCILFLRT